MNLRLVVFLAIAVMPFLVGIVYPVVTFNGGIKHHADYDEIDLKALGCFPFDPTNGSINDVPKKWRALEGKRVQFDGFANALNNAGGDMSHFEIVFNRAICCVGVPKVHERVFVNMPPGKSVPFLNYGRFTGILHVNVENAAGLVTSVYTLDVEKAEAL